MRKTIKTLAAALVLAACGPSADQNMWECQLSVQKGNAGKDAAAAAERARDIEACMDGRGFRLESTKAACSPGTTDPGCYAAR